MKLKKLTAVLLSALSICFPLNIKYIAQAENSSVKIMSIGDSITDGYGTDGSYRKFLYHELTEQGYSIDMTGPNWSWGDAVYTDEATGESFSYDAAHCGYSGYAIKEYSGRNGILETLQSGNYLAEYTPDIVILQIGTNDVIDNHDVDTAGERLEILIDYISENVSDNTDIFVTTIPYLEPNNPDVYEWFGNYRHSADWQTTYSDDEAEQMVKSQVDNYNEQVKNLIQEKQDNGASNIFFGDINSVITDTSAQLKDGVHPNDTGYKLMGEYWAEIIGDALSGNKPDIPENPEIIQGDLDNDGIISVKDILIMKKHILDIQPIDENSLDAADMNSDKIIDVIDLVYLKRSYLKIER